MFACLHVVTQDGCGGSLGGVLTSSAIPTVGIAQVGEWRFLQQSCAVIGFIDGIRELRCITPLVALHQHMGTVERRKAFTEHTVFCSTVVVVISGIAM